MLCLKNVSKGFGKKEILHDISCDLETGVYGLLGKNGAGKTTLMRCIAGIYTDWSGNITMDQEASNRKQIKVGYLPQGFGMFQEFRVYDALKYMCCMKKIKKKDQPKEIELCLKAVHLWDKKWIKIHSLSGGMVRRVGIAQALLGNPDILLFDEPTAGLDPEERLHFKKVLCSLGENRTVIVSTHIVEDVQKCCNYVIFMKQGTIDKMGSCKEILLEINDRAYRISE